MRPEEEILPHPDLFLLLTTVLSSRAYGGMGDGNIGH
jgi:hypothetical protein